MADRESDGLGNVLPDDEISRLRQELARVRGERDAAREELKENRAALTAMLADSEQDRRQISNARREWRAVFDAVRNPMFIHDRDGIIVRANRAYAERVGLPFKEILGKPYWTVFPPGDGPHHQSHDSLTTHQAGEEELHLDTGEIFICRDYPVSSTRGEHIYSLHVLEDVTERRAAEKERGTLSEALRQLAESVVVLDTEQRITYVNPAFYHTFGYQPEDVLGIPINTLMLPGPIGGVAPDEVVRRIRENTTWAGEVCRRAKDGSAIPIYLNAASIYDAAGQITGYVGTYLDLRELKRSEAELMRLRKAIDNSGEAVFLTDANGTITFVNPEFTRLYGYTADEVVNKTTPRILKSGKQTPEHYREFWAAITAKKEVRDNIVNLTKDGREVAIERTVNPIVGDDGNVEGFLAIQRDVTARLHTEAERERLAAILETATDFISSADTNGHVLYYNRAAREMLGIAPDADISNIRIPDTHPEWAARLVMEEGLPTAIREGVWSGETALLSHDGREIPMSQVILRHQDPGGKVTYLSTIMRDISERKRTEKELARVNRALRAISACNSVLVHSADADTLLQDICRIVVEVGNYRMAWVGFAENDEKKSIRPVASSGAEKGYLEKVDITWADAPDGRGPAARAIRENALQISTDIASDDTFGRYREGALKRGYASCITLPLAAHGTAMGMLAIYAGTPNAFLVDEITLLKELAEDLAFGLNALRVRGERDEARINQQRHLDRLRETLEKTIAAIAATVEMRDPYTAGHQRRVADLATAIAQEMGLPENKIRGIHLAGIIHDLGKIYIPAEILSKPSRLSPVEYQMIKTHPQVGYDIIKDIDFPWPIARMVLEHHERLDGSGYPNGLKGDAILPESRLLAVADVVEAMASHRPYRPGLGAKQALEEITRNRGKIYDPEVVDACVRLIRERGYDLTPPSS